MIKPIFLFTVLLIVTLASGLQAAPVYADKPTAEASGLMKQYVMSSVAERVEVLHRLEVLSTKHPDNVNVRRMYANLLVSDRKYDSAISQYEMLNKKNPRPVLLLPECMLKERVGKKDKGCYQSVIAIAEEKNILDSDYLTALYFADDQRFLAEKEKLINANKMTKAELAVFSLSRERILYTLYP